MTEPLPVYATDADAEAAGMSDLERTFQTYWNMLAPLELPEPVREYRFCKRRWRFDFAWPEQLVAVELQGGTWSRGRHSRGGGYRDDCEKLNKAQSLSWCIFYFTTGMLTDDPEQCIRVVAEKVMERIPC